MNHILLLKMYLHSLSTHASSSTSFVRKQLSSENLGRGFGEFNELGDILESSESSERVLRVQREF